MFTIWHSVMRLHLEKEVGVTDHTICVGERTPLRLEFTQLLHVIDDALRVVRVLAGEDHNVSPDAMLVAVKAHTVRWI